MADTTRVLGVVNGTNVDKNSNPIAWITPLVDASGGWDPLPLDDWPSGTKVFWPLAKGALKDSLVYFQPKENPADQKDRYIAGDVQLALEVIDCSVLKSEASLRHRFTSEAGGEQRTGLALILGPNNDVFGPVRLAGQPGKSSVVEPTARHRIPVHRKGDIALRQVRSLGRTRLVAERQPSQPYRYTDWDDDAIVIKRALEFVVEQSRKERASNALSLTKKMIAEVAQSFAALGDAPDQLLQRERLERSRDLLTSSTASRDVLAKVVESIQQLPEVKAALDSELAKERELVQARVELEFERKKGALKALDAELAALNTILTEKKAAIEAAERERTSVTAKIQEAVDARIAEVLRQPETMLADVVVLKSLLSSSAPSAPRAQASAVTVSVSSQATWTAGESMIADGDEFRKTLLRSLRALGVSGESVIPLVATALSGKVPMLYGTGAQRALRAYADVVAAGRLHFVSVAPTLTRMQDLFGTLDQSARAFVPHADGLLDLVSAASQSDGYSVVCFDGLNLAATEAVFLPLLNAIADQRAINVAHPRAIHDADPYKRCLSFTWPRNLILIGTLVEGPTSLPVALEIWRHAVLVQAEVVAAVDPAAPPIRTELMPNSVGSEQPAIAIAKAAFLEFQEYSGFVATAADFAQFVSGGDDQREIAVAKAFLLPLCGSAESSEEAADRLARALRLDKQSTKVLLQRVRRVVA